MTPLYGDGHFIHSISLLVCHVTLSGLSYSILGAVGATLTLL